ncbi:MAG: DUF2478 domain-containing protein [Methyloligellaceae bacterium]
MSEMDQSLIGAIRHEFGFDANRMLRQIAERLRQCGVVLAGAVQDSATAEGDCCASMELIDVRTERVARISQDLGRHAQGCRLDQRGLADAAESISRAIAAGVDLVIINKFGKAESEGDGLTCCFAEAVAAGTPVLTSVRAPYIDTWEAFHGGMAIELPPSPDAVLRWCGSVTGADLMRVARSASAPGEGGRGLRAIS